MSDFNLEEEIMRSSDKWNLYSSSEKYNLAMSNYWEGKFDAYTNCRVLTSRIEKLEQQLSNSISKDEIRKLAEDLKKSHFTKCNAGRGEESRNQEVIWLLNKLIEGDNNG